MDRTDTNKWLVGEVPLQFGLARIKPQNTDTPSRRRPGFCSVHLLDVVRCRDVFFEVRSPY